MGANKPGVVNRRRSPLRERFGHADRRAPSNLQYNPGRPGRPGARTRAVNDEGQFAHFLTVGSVAAWVLWAEHEYRGLTYCPWNERSKGVSRSPGLLGGSDEQLVDSDAAVAGHDVGHRVRDVPRLQRDY